jgi:hypothetical protein
VRVDVNFGGQLLSQQRQVGGGHRRIVYVDPFDAGLALKLFQARSGDSCATNY